MDPYEQIENKEGYHNGSYTWYLITRVDRIEFEVCRNQEGLFQCELFRRYQRSEQALILSMIDLSGHAVKKGESAMLKNKFTQN